jgi:hypothetical protein
MLEAARNDLEGATTYYRGLATELGWISRTTQTPFAKVYCHGCKNIRMEQVYIHGHGGRYFWHCAKGHLEHGHTTPQLHNVTAPESCTKSNHFVPIALIAEGEVHGR